MVDKLGGPGSSGVATLINLKDTFLKVFGAEYNFIAFDPRGVNNTGPSFSCEESGTYFNSQPIAEQWVQAKANGERCTLDNQDTDAKYVGTPAVVQDMMHFTELQAEAKGKDPKEEKIWYFGVSYGTVIGQTLAAMYPDRLGRVILDGNVDGTEYYNGYTPSSVNSTDEAFGLFFKHCYQAGPELCPLATNTSSAADVETRYQTVLRMLDAEPMYIPETVRLLNRRTFENNAFNSLYQPGLRYYTLAKTIDSLGQRNLTDYDLFSKLIGASGSKAIRANPEYTTAAESDMLMFITCVDNAGRYPLKTVQAYRNAVEDLYEKSGFGSRYAYGNPLLCNGFGITPPESQFFPGFETTTNTSVPLLFIGNTGDPVTPLSSAHRMSDMFPGSRVLTQKSPGHGFFSLDSKCTHEHVKAYMDKGTLPDEGTLCKIDDTAAQIFEKGAKVYEAILNAVAKTGQ